MTEERWAYHAPAEFHRVFIPCMAGNNAFTDCMVTVAHGRAVITGHPVMEFSQEECIRLADTLITAAARL